MQKLCRTLEGQYDVLYTNYPLYGRKCKLAEIDVMALRRGRVDVFEVKCSRRVVKAKKQLRRIKRILKDDSVNTFFYCGAANAIMEVFV